MSCLVKCATDNKRITFFFFPMRVGPVRVTIYNERAVAQVDIRIIQRIILSGTRNQTNSPLPPPQKKKPCRLHTVI